MTPPVIAVENDPDRPSVRRLVLSGAVTVASAVDLHRRAVELAAGGTDVVVDCTAAEHLDASALQLVLALGREVERSGRRCQVVAGGAAAAFRVAGLGGLVPA